MKTIRREAAKLSFRDGEVMVTPKDQDIFFINAEKATEACSAVIRQEERVTKFKEEIVLPLARWREDHKEKVSACYLLVPESAVIPVYMIGTSEQYDFDLTQELSMLSSDFEQRGWSVHFSQIPRCTTDELAAFFLPDNALQIDG